MQYFSYANIKMNSDKMAMQGMQTTLSSAATLEWYEYEVVGAACRIAITTHETNSS